ncbi:MAG: hypothetical protein JXR76_24810 [Deltaproteobacteria bacterium]|nr:hypothetical protein [Deltaproteobacteria bacterium]
MSAGRQSLLKIDVVLEIRKLTQNRFKSGTEWAVVLCRYLMGRNCQSLNIHLENGRILVQSSGTGIPEDVLRRLGIIFNVAEDVSLRHQAILEIEESDSFDLLCAFYPAGATVGIKSGAAELRVAHGQRTALSVAADDGSSKNGSPVTLLEVKSRKIKANPLFRVIESACRYARLPVVLNGKKISDGLTLNDCFAQQFFELDGIQGVVGIPVASDFVRQIVLRHGIMVKDSLKQPAFGLLYHVIADSHKEVEELQMLRPVVRNLYLKLGAMVEQLPAQQKKRAVDVLFGRFLETRDPQYIHNVRAFESTTGRYYTLAEMRNLAMHGPLFAIPSESAPKGQFSQSWLLCGRRVFVLDIKQWNFLEKELGISITVPPIGGNVSDAPVRLLNGNGEIEVPEKPFTQETRLAAERIIRNLD